MASGRCYTKSGSVEKYESELWSMDSFGIVVIITGPDSIGNYNVLPPKEYEDSNTQTEFGCTIDYAGIKKTFYFKKAINYIYLSCQMELADDGVNGVGFMVNLYFTNNEYLGNDRLSVLVEIIATDPYTFIDSVYFSVNKNSRSPLKQPVNHIGGQTGRPYNTKIKKCNPMSGDNYKVIIQL